MKGREWRKRVNKKKVRRPLNRGESRRNEMKVNEKAREEERGKMNGKQGFEGEKRANNKNGLK